MATAVAVVMWHVRSLWLLVEDLGAAFWAESAHALGSSSSGSEANAGSPVTEPCACARTSAA